jgi:alkane 1-monooxygenase
MQFRIRALKYSLIFAAMALGFFSLLANGIFTWTLPVYTFVLIPLLELLFPADDQNLSETEAEVARADKLYDFLLYLIVPVQYALLGVFGWRLLSDSLLWYETLGLVVSMGIGCGVNGINVGHELGHRSRKSEQFLAKLLLLSSLYLHFFIEHNRGHHKNVSTDEDPASARYGEILYLFWFRSIIGSYLSAWRLENDRLRRKGVSVFSLQNEMLQFQLIQGVFVGLIFAFGGWFVGLCFLGAALIGILLLETVNYIEHYGLRREKLAEDRYERVLPAHSWNSDHVLGRLMLFELSRHSDHHYRAGRKYQLLRHMEGSPQMPTGYPGMIILSTIPPLWFAVMHRQIARFQEG